MSTKWKDNHISINQTCFNSKSNSFEEKERILNEVIESILNKEDDNIHKDLDETAYKDFNNSRVFNNNQKITINNRTILYNSINFSFNKVRPELSNTNIPIEERTIFVKGTLIVYITDTGVFYITDRNSDAKTIIRKLLGYSKVKEIEQVKPDINNDFIIWIIYNIYTDNTFLELENEYINLKEIEAFQGDTKDRATTIKAEGTSVMNLISTLSFLLESDIMESIKLNLSISSNHNISLKIQTNQYIEISVDEYSGRFRQSEQDFSALFSILHIYVYNDLLIKLLQLYQDNKEAGLWSTKEYKNFLTNLGEDISTKIKNKLASE